MANGHIDRSDVLLATPFNGFINSMYNTAGTTNNSGEQ